MSVLPKVENQTELIDLNLFDQEDNIERAVRTLKVLAHPARLKIVCLLQFGEHSVQSLEKQTGVAQATLSQHLSVLKDRGVVMSRRDGHFMFYRLSSDDMRDLFQVIRRVFCD